MRSVGERRREVLRRVQRRVVGIELAHSAEVVRLGLALEEETPPVVHGPQGEHSPACCWGAVHALARIDSSSGGREALSIARSTGRARERGRACRERRSA